MERQTHFPTIPLAELTANGNGQADSLKSIVLVVDDEPVIAETLRVILTQSGFVAMTAHNGLAALETAEIIPPDLLLTDVVMPGMSGIDLARTIARRIPACKILLFSGHAHTTQSPNASDSHGQEFTLLSKPLHPTALLAAIRQTLCLTPSIREDTRVETMERKRVIQPLTPRYEPRELAGLSV